MAFFWSESGMNSRSFFLPDKSGYVIFEPHVLEHMYKHVQRHFYQTEAGGQIFSAVPDDPAVIVKSITGPNPGDIRKRHGYVPHPKQATADRIMQLQQGTFPVGLWHTHPEAHPKPSGQDQQTTKEWLADFQGNMHGFLLVILGNKGAPPNITVWLATSAARENWIQLTEQ
jgi:integrative and conjugative element protein (TIGR02256 family)